MHHQQPVWGEHGIKKLENYISLVLCRLLETVKMTSSFFGVQKIPEYIQKTTYRHMNQLSSNTSHKWDIRLKTTKQNQKIL